MATLSARPRPASSGTPQNLSGTKSVTNTSNLTAPYLSLCNSKYLILLFCIGVIQKEFEIELEGSQYLRILCYEKCYDKSMLNKDDNEIVDKIMGKGQVQVRKRPLTGHHRNTPVPKRDFCVLLGTFPSMWLILISCLASTHNGVVLSLWPLMVLVGLIVWQSLLKGDFPCLVVRNVPIKIPFSPVN